MIRLPLRFGDKVKAKKLEVGFLVVDVPTTYHPTLHRVKATITPYLLQLQFEANDGSVGTMTTSTNSQKGGSKKRTKNLGTLNVGSSSRSLPSAGPAPSPSWSGLEASLSRGMPTDEIPLTQDPDPRPVPGGNPLPLNDFSASASALERASSSWCSKSFRSASKASFSFFNFSERRLYLAAASSNL
ncbi:hypothetical protein Cgig2_000858 [Carnegiea gigantea]|uniref:Uncharacterized protein n=1 Tax=Carnegiea gigantea TaxID=171969 RepID=A0A9Q1JZT6_9CARY|nr:hypothetical protein Cgig2_000858 [Carnegiea gigantea]